jgi:hypothetical protein
MDFSFVIPPGVGISTGAVHLYTNTVPPVAADTDWVIGAVSVRGRAVYASLTGGVEGKDYQVRWSATDSDGNIWPRTALVLCAQTS